jgi:methyl-accepting chemotaxis protein
MFVSKTNEVLATLAALNRSHAVIEFKMDGTIVTANENFLVVTGYRLADIRGRPHAIFVAAKERHSIAYRRFWDGLNRGEFQSGQYRHIGKHGRDVWIQATYSPILKRSGKPFKVIALATDITERRQRDAGRDGQGGARLSPAVVALGSDAGLDVRVQEPVAETIAIPGEEAPGGATAPETAEPASRIGNVVDMINRIAAENNLAALQAAIEAAHSDETMIGDPRPRSQLRRPGRTA